MYTHEMDMHVYFYIIQSFNVYRETLWGLGYLNIKQNSNTLFPVLRQCGFALTDVAIVLTP